MRQHAEISFAKVNENGDLENGIRIQMSQVDVIKIKEAAEKRRDGKAEAAEKKRSIDYRLVGILCWDSSPAANPPRTEFSRRKNPDGHEMEELGLRDDGHVVTCERQLAVGVDWRNHHSRRTRGLPLRRHLDSTREQSGRRMAERIRKRESKN